ncbi:hypothetical protein [Cryobacterium luteum]|uniref:Uncharacterized protein n=1 Tax=Cryobacterium luteum TaxID=1424661 RepID=A0A5F0D172_9MICO|nr:hypothetical protein [Cryobacterium luteum]TFB86663.1 hypothetical protein E3O10_13660 [Cryobacterium luteum]
MALLGGCAALRGGQSVDGAVLGIETLPGVASANVSQITTLSGFKRIWTTTVAITLEPDYRIDDAEAALDWAMHTAWSVNDNEPNLGISVGFLDSSGNTADWDWQTAASALGYDSPSVGALMTATGTLSFGPSVLGDTLGPWPGDVPELADGVIVAD